MTDQDDDGLAAASALWATINEPDAIKNYRSMAVMEWIVSNLDRLAKLDIAATQYGCAYWLEMQGNGIPLISMVAESACDDARFWAGCASPHELEAYAVAISDEIKQNLFGSRQIKRLAASIYRRMSPDERLAFMEWAKNAQ